MSNFDAIPDLLADILNEQRTTRLAIVSLAEAIAGVRATNDTIVAISKAKSVEADGIPAVDELFPKSAAAPVVAAGQPTAKVDVPTPTASAPAPAAAYAASPAPASTVATEPLTYDQVAKAITEGVKVNRDHVVAILAKFSAKKGTELKVEQYADFLAALA